VRRRALFTEVTTRFEGVWQLVLVQDFGGRRTLTYGNDRYRRLDAVGTELQQIVKKVLAQPGGVRLGRSGMCCDTIGLRLRRISAGLELAYERGDRPRLALYGSGGSVESLPDLGKTIHIAWIGVQQEVCDLEELIRQPSEC
jgi:hypothetical protein